MSPQLKQTVDALESKVRELSDIVMMLPRSSPDFSARIIELQTALWHFMQTQREWDEVECVGAVDK